MTTRLLHIVGARPNFMKAAAVLQADPGPHRFVHVLVHTGQHYDALMSDRFFEDLSLPKPDHHLGVGGGSHAQNTGRTMIELEPVVERERPDWLVVYGDVNATLAGALVAAKLGVRIAHVEAGVRSGDRSMPEEINRLVTDRVADLCLTPSRGAHAHLDREGVEPSRVAFVGNVMVDTLLRLREPARALGMAARLGVTPGQFAVTTLHRAGNVDVRETLAELLGALADLAARMPVLFPVHPRTRNRIREFGLEELARPIRLLDPLGYLELIGLVDEAALVLTDSGGLQAETTVLGVPCLTARTTTEWTETLTEGTNRLVPPSRSALGDAVRDVLAHAGSRASRRPDGWDGLAGARVLAAIAAARGPAA